MSEINNEPEATMRLISKREVQEKTTFSSVTLWRMEKAGTFPKRVQISPGRVAWLESDVDEWIQQKLSNALVQAQRNS